MKENKYLLPVLMYHRVVEKRSDAGKHKIYVFKEQFEKQLQYLKYNGYEAITFNQLQQFNPQTDLSKKIILTFDDGYIDNYEIALPLLEKYGFNAVLFLVTRLKTNTWGVKDGEPEIPMMNDEQLKALIDYGIEIGGHTQHHMPINEIPENKALEEVTGCKNDIKERFGIDPISFAYPFGGIHQKAKEIVKNAGFKFGIATNTGPLNIWDDLMQIRRIDIGPRTSMGSFKHKVSGQYFTKKSIYTLFSSH
ncbi:MAG: hypothetical protein Kow0079_05920 [Vicingaceae bacterium]